VVDTIPREIFESQTTVINHDTLKEEKVVSSNKIVHTEEGILAVVALSGYTSPGRQTSGRT